MVNFNVGGPSPSFNPVESQSAAKSKEASAEVETNKEKSKPSNTEMLTKLYSDKLNGAQKELENLSLRAVSRDFEREQYTKIENKIAVLDKYCKNAAEEFSSDPEVKMNNKILDLLDREEQLEDEGKDVNGDSELAAVKFEIGLLHESIATLKENQPGLLDDAYEALEKEHDAEAALKKEPASKGLLDDALAAIEKELEQEKGKQIQ